MTTRAEHLAWCKRRALEYVDAGLLTDAVTSMSCDLAKHPETRSAISPAEHIEVATMNTEDIVRFWINEFK